MPPPWAWESQALLKHLLSVIQYRFKVAELHIAVSKFKLKKTGSKSDLIGRVSDHLTNVEVFKDADEFRATAAELYQLVGIPLPDIPRNVAPAAPPAPPKLVALPVPPPKFLQPHQAKLVFASDTFYRSVCGCGRAGTGVPGGIIMCSAMGCGAVWHRLCVGLPDAASVPGASAPARKPFKCATCRCAQLAPTTSLEAVLNVSLLRPALPGTADSTSIASVTMPIEIECGGALNSLAGGVIKAGGRSVRVACLNMSTGGASPSLMWPTAGVLTINMSELTLTPGAVLDVTNLLREGRNSVMLRIPPGGMPAESGVGSGAPSFALVAMLVRDLSPDLLTGALLNTRQLPPRLASLTLAATFGLANSPVQPPHWRGLTSLDAASLWASVKLGTAPVNPWGEEPAGESSPEVSEVRSDGGGDACVMSNLQLDLRDPISRVLIEVPARGEACTHPQAFDLKNFITTHTKPGAHWRCPVCRRELMPCSLVVDTFQLAVLTEFRARGAAGLAACAGETVEATIKRLAGLVGDPVLGSGMLRKPPAGSGSLAQPYNLAGAVKAALPGAVDVSSAAPLGPKVLCVSEPLAFKTEGASATALYGMHALVPLAPVCAATPAEVDALTKHGIEVNRDGKWAPRAGGAPAIAPVEEGEDSLDSEEAALAAARFGGPPPQSPLAAPPPLQQGAPPPPPQPSNMVDLSTLDDGARVGSKRPRPAEGTSAAAPLVISD